MQPVSANPSVEPSTLPSLPSWAWGVLDRARQNRLRPTDRLWLDPTLLLRRCGMNADAWQQTVLSSTAARLMLLCSRQVGKTTTTAALALRTALLEAPATILVVCPAERQSAEFVLKVKQFYAALRQPERHGDRVLTVHEKMLAEAGADDFFVKLPRPVRESALQLHLANGSRIIGLPSNEGGIRGFSSINLLVIDEAARLADAVYKSMRPVLAVSKGRVVALSTPYGKQGWYYEAWKRTLERAGRGDDVKWQVVSITADQCPRLTPEFLADELEDLGEPWFRQEYYCEFRETVESVFPAEAVERAARAGDRLRPLWG